MFFFRFLNTNPDDRVAVMLCLITIWWCVRYVPSGPGPTRFVLAILGVLAACFGTQTLDAMISAAFLVAAILLELSPRSAGRDDEVLRNSFGLR
jgi:hypothetical protein